MLLRYVEPHVILQYRMPSHESGQTKGDMERVKMTAIALLMSTASGKESELSDRVEDR